MTHEGQRGVYFDSDGHRLLGTLFVPQEAGPHPIALLLHGLPGIEKNYDLAHALRARGWCSLLFHYRGSWGSEGDFAFETIPDDVRAALDEVSSGKYPEVRSKQIVLIGHSLGGWASVLAGTDPRVSGVAVYGTVASPTIFTFSVEEAEQEFAPWLHGVTAEQLVEEWNALGASHDPFERVASIAPRPLLILHGGEDPVVPPAHAEALAGRAHEPYEFEVVPAANHAWAWHRDTLQRRLFTWLDQLELQ